MRSRVNELFTQSRSAAGSRSIVSMMQDDGEQIGRFKVRGLMRELELVSKQPGSHAYKQATVVGVEQPPRFVAILWVDVPLALASTACAEALAFGG